MTGRSGWYGVRCLIRFPEEGADQLYEESVTVWHAVSFEEAIMYAPRGQ